MTCFLCKCGVAIYYDSLNHDYTNCTGCGLLYKVDSSGKLIAVPPLEEFNLDRLNPFKEK